MGWQKGTTAQGIPEEKENRTIRWAQSTYQGAVGACQTGMVIWSGRAQYLGWPDKPQIWCPRDWGWGRAGFPSLAFLLPQHFPLWMDWAGMDLSPGCAPFMGHIEAQDSRRTGLTVRRPLCMQHAAMQRNLPGWQRRLSGRCPGALGKEGRV